jgi:hypothetical protein
MNTVVWVDDITSQVWAFNSHNIILAIRGDSLTGDSIGKMPKKMRFQFR